MPDKKHPIQPSRDFLNKIGLGEGLQDLPTDELFLRAKRANPDPRIASHPINAPPQSYSSARSFSKGFDGREILMPQVVNGFVLTPDDATKYMLRTGRHFGTYDTPENANKAGQRLHELQELHDYLLSVGKGR